MQQLRGCAGAGKAQQPCHRPAPWRRVPTGTFVRLSLVTCPVAHYPVTSEKISFNQLNRLDRVPRRTQADKPVAIERWDVAIASLREATVVCAAKQFSRWESRIALPPHGTAPAAEARGPSHMREPRLFAAARWVLAQLSALG